MEYRILYFSGDSRGVIACPVREGGSAVASVRGLESQEGACESLKGPVALAIDILFWFVFTFWGYFQLFLLKFT